MVPGADGETSLYEDEGDTQNYQTGAFTQTAIRQQRTAEHLVLTVAPRSGQFEGMLSERSYVVRFLSEDQPQSVLVNDQSVDTWSYDAERRELVVTLPATSCGESLTVKVQRSTTGISMLSDKAIFSEEYFDLQGRRLQSVQPATPCIVRRTWSDGRVTNHKVLNHD